MNVILILLCVVIKRRVFLLILLLLLLLCHNLAIFLLSMIFMPLKHLLLMLLRNLMNYLHGYASGFLIILLNCLLSLKMNLIERRRLSLGSFRNQLIALVLSLLPQLFQQYLESKTPSKTVPTPSQQPDTTVKP